MSQTQHPNPELLRQWMQEDLSPDLLRERLQQHGHDADTIDSWLSVYRKTSNGRKQFMAFLCMGGGAVLGFLSCVLAIFDPIPGWHGFFMYGLTSVAILVVFAGLYILFE